MRDYLAVPIVFVAAAAIGVALVALLRLVGPTSMLVERNRLPDWWGRFTAWARSRSLRLWCPKDATATAVAGHLATPMGRRLSRLGVSMAEGPYDADVIVVASGDRDDVDRWRRATPAPTASIVLTDPSDLDEFTDAMVRLAAALRWPEENAAK